MFGVGLPELAVLAFLAVLLFGPDRLPEFARQAGRFVRQLRVMANNARDDLRSELGPEFADLELRDLDPRTLVRKHVLAAMEEDDNTTITPPKLHTLAPGEPAPYDPDAT